MISFFVDSSQKEFPCYDQEPIAVYRLVVVWQLRVSHSDDSVQCDLAVPPAVGAADIQNISLECVEATNS